MLGENFRPWGEFKWLTSKSNKLDWNIIGCISFESRCTGLNDVILKDQVNKNLYINIIPPISIFQEKQNEEQLKNYNYLINNGIKKDQIIDIPLHGNIDSFLRPLEEYMSIGNGNYILDISSFPKRFFFPILKRIMQNKKLQNLIVTYTKPEKYTKEELSWDPSDWNHIPTFMSNDFRESKVDIAIIAVGFVPLGLPKLLVGKYIDAEVKLLFPHPPGPPHYQRNWEFVRKIVDSYPRLTLNDMQRVHALDCSDSFDMLCNLTNDGKYNSILAPYGPKPISLAMALFAISTGVPIYYTQPNYYAHDYSSGTKETYGYWVVNSGENLYSLKKVKLINS